MSLSQASPQSSEICGEEEEEEIFHEAEVVDDSKDAAFSRHHRDHAQLLETRQ